MILENKTELDVSRLERYVAGHDTSGLHASVRYTRKGARTPYSGVCYYKKGKIRVSVNPKNKYPLTVRVGSPFDRAAWRFFDMESAEELVSFVFLHEFSHFLDYRNGTPMRCKQTKSDLYALRRMGRI